MTNLAVRKPAVFLTTLVLLAPVAALAQQQQKKAPPKVPPKAAPAAKETATLPGGAQAFLVGTFGDWKALITGKDKQKICYALSQPKERLPAKLARDPGYLFISSRVADGTKNEVAIKLGFAGKTGQDGALQIGTGAFALVASADNAFLKNAAQENQLIEAMKKNAALTIKVSSARGNETTDKYSLNGFGKALEAVAKECP